MENRAQRAAWISFEDPDGNGWLVQEITTRRPDRWLTARGPEGTEQAI